MRFRWLFLLTTVVILWANPLENIPTDSWIYEAVDYLKTAGLIRSVPSTSRPWTRSYAARLVADAVEHSKQSPPVGFAAGYLQRLQIALADELQSESSCPGLNWHRPLLHIPIDSIKTINVDLFSRFRADTQNQSGALGLLFRTEGRPGFSAYSRSEFIAFRETIPNLLDSAWFRHVPGYRADRYRRNYVVDLTEAYMRFPLPWLELELGRSYVYWGPGYLSSVMLAHSAPSLDKVQLTANYQRFKFTSFTAALSMWRSRHRFLSAQRLEVNFPDWLVAGAALFVVHAIEPDTTRNTDGTQTKNFWAYLNPLLPLYPEMANANHTDNLLVGCDFAAYLPRIKLYGQLLVDNLQWDQYVPWEEQPPLAIGVQAGLLAPVLPRLNLRYEYARIYNFTYYHWAPQLSFTSYQVPLGHSLGPDADQHYAETDWCLLPWAHIGLHSSLIRRGSRNFGDWTNRTWFPGVNHQERQFPSGKVVREINFGPRLVLEPLPSLRFTGSGAWYICQQPDDAGPAPEKVGPGITFDARLEIRY